MKFIENNSINTIVLVKENVDFSLATHLSFNQITTGFEKLVPINYLDEDCFTATLELDLVENYTPNGLYTVDIVDINKNVLSGFTTKVSGMGVGDKREYIIEDGEGTGPSKLEIPTNIKVTREED